MSIGDDPIIDEDLDFDHDGSTLGEQLVEAVMDDSYTRAELRSPVYGIENSLCRMAEAFVDAAQDRGHIDDLAKSLKEFGDLDTATARDQAKHAYEVMEAKLPEICPV